MPLGGACAEVLGLLDRAGAELAAEAEAFRRDRTTEVATTAEAAEAGARGFARVPWAEIEGAGEALLAEQAITVRCLRRHDGSLADHDDEPDLVAVVGRGATEAEPARSPTGGFTVVGPPACYNCGAVRSARTSLKAWAAAHFVLRGLGAAVGARRQNREVGAGRGSAKVRREEADDRGRRAL